MAEYSGKHESHCCRCGEYHREFSTILCKKKEQARIFLFSLENQPDQQTSNKPRNRRSQNQFCAWMIREDHRPSQVERQYCRTYGKTGPTAEHRNYQGSNAGNDGCPEKKCEYIKQGLGFRQKNEEGKPYNRQDIRGNRAHENPGEFFVVIFSRTCVIDHNLGFR